MGRKGLSIGLLGISRCQKGFVLEAGLALPTEAVKRTLSFGRQVKAEIPGNSRCGCGRVALRTNGQDRELPRRRHCRFVREMRLDCARSGIPCCGGAS